MSETLFINPLVNGYKDNVSDPFYSRYTSVYDPQHIIPLDEHRVQQLTMNSGDSVTFTPADLSLDYGCSVILKVVGTARIKTLGFDISDAASELTGYIQAFGTEIFPGYAMISCANMTSFVVECQANSTVVELFIGTKQDTTLSYSYGTFTLTNTDVMGGSAQTVYYTKVGKAVSLRAPANQSTVTAGGNSCTMTAQIPAALRPVSGNFYFPVLIYDNGATLQQGVGLITTLGNLTIYRNPTLAGTNWTLAAGGGWQQWAAAYSIA